MKPQETSTRVYVCVHVRMCACVACVACVHVCMCACVHVCMCARVKVTPHGHALQTCTLEPTSFTGMSRINRPQKLPVVIAIPSVTSSV